MSNPPTVDRPQALLPAPNPQLDFYRRLLAAQTRVIFMIATPIVTQPQDIANLLYLINQSPDGGAESAERDLGN